MVRTGQSKICLTTLFVVLFGLIQNSGVAQSPERGVQTDSGARQEAPAQTADKNSDELKDREALNRFLSAARKGVEEYNRLFRDLATEEKRTSILFNRSGDKGKPHEVICDFVVYQSRIDPNLAFEYRNAKSVDGKRVSGQEKRMMTLFENLAKAETALKERELINKESFDHDKIKFVFYGTVIYQWRELMDYARDSVEIGYVGNEEIDGQQTVVIDFHQKVHDERLEWNAPLRLNHLEQRVRGRLWLDARSAQIRRAERELRVIMPGASNLAPIWKQTFDYAKSDLGVLVPKRFVYDLFFDTRRSDDGHVESFQTGRLISEFGTFQRFTVSSSEEEKKAIIKDKP
jgi:hypothetical protein